jgi:hypothetical protein
MTAVQCRCGKGPAALECRSTPSSQRCIPEHYDYPLGCLVSSRYKRASLIVTSNKPFSAWGEIFGDEVTAAAMIDRLVHHAEILRTRRPADRTERLVALAETRSPRGHRRSSLNAPEFEPWMLVDAAWTSNRQNGVSADDRKADVAG